MQLRTLISFCFAYIAAIRATPIQRGAGSAVAIPDATVPDSARPLPSVLKYMPAAPIEAESKTINLDNALVPRSNSIGSFRDEAPPIRIGTHQLEDNLELTSASSLPIRGELFERQDKPALLGGIERPDASLVGGVIRRQTDIPKDIDNDWDAPVQLPRQLFDGVTIVPHHSPDGGYHFGVSSNGPHVNVDIDI
ncbi:hypothetical protein BKA70DRAFT_1557075 [Coprinopsis sp. MPI-PUGE-AT-0042]|nr:hypothetical protein BKA70DRAFT_1557075 [Coprinopsis sp. MPI-PUGE-AT-0042]